MVSSQHKAAAAPEAVHDQVSAVERAPEHEVPARSVPDAGDDEYSGDVEGPPADASAAERDVNIITEPLAERHVPLPPEIHDARRGVGAAEIQREANAEASPRAECDETVTGEVEIDAQTKEHVREPDQIGVLARFAVDERPEIVGEAALEEEADDHEGRSRVEVLRQPAIAEVLQLRREVCAAFDRTGDELREEAREVDEIEKARQRLTQRQRIDDEADDLKRVERNAHRNQQPAHESHVETERLVQREIGILVMEQRQEQQRQQHHQPVPEKALVILGDPAEARIRRHQHRDEDGEGQPVDRPQEKQAQDPDAQPIVIPEPFRREPRHEQSHAERHDQPADQQNPES
jgi:hypothetical protein